jgi:hypothetical protein
MRLTTFAAGVLMACGAATLSGCASAPPPPCRGRSRQQYR